MVELCRDAVLGRFAYSLGGGKGRRLVELVERAGSLLTGGGGSGVGVLCSATLGRSGDKVVLALVLLACRPRRFAELTERCAD